MPTIRKGHRPYAPRYEPRPSPHHRLQARPPPSQGPHAHGRGKPHPRQTPWPRCLSQIPRSSRSWIATPIWDRKSPSPCHPRSVSELHPCPPCADPSSSRCWPAPPRSERVRALPFPHPSAPWPLHRLENGPRSTGASPRVIQRPLAAASKLQMAAPKLQNGVAAAAVALALSMGTPNFVSASMQPPAVVCTHTRCCPEPHPCLRPPVLVGNPVR